MEDGPHRITFNFKDQDWELYTQHRPSYPKAVFDHIFEYHKKHNGQFNEALDIGAGNGIVTRNLLEKFSHVTFSDVAEQYVGQAKERFASFGPDKVSFLHAGFGDLSPQKFPSSKLDLATGATCFHFLGEDRKTFPARMAKIIKPGGTFAPMGYGGYPLYPESEPGHKEFVAIYQQYMDYFQKNLAPFTADAPVGIMNARLEYFDFDPQVWENVRRLHAWYEKPCVPNAPRAESSVKKDVESVEFFEDQGIISKDAGFDWIYGFYVNLYPAVDAATVCKDQLAALKEAMGDKTVRLQWPFDMVLATRK